MSTLKTTNIQHPSAGSPNLVLAADGSVSGGADLSSGLKHVSTSNFSGVSSVALDSVFSSSPSVYLLVINSQGTLSTTTYLSFNMRSSGTPLNSSNSYQFLGIYGTTSAGPNRDYQLNTFGVLGNIGNVSGQAVVWITLPASSNYPILFSQMFGTGTSATVTGNYNTRIVNPGSYDGIQFQPASGTMSGTYRLYKLQNS